ncbi:outer membrane beta-barrel protein [Bacteroidota bacterium]
MKFFLLPGFILLSIFTYSQDIKYSIKLNYNYPFISDVVEEEPTVYYSPSAAGFVYINDGTVVETYKSKSGGKLSGNINYAINSRLSIEGGLQLNLIRYQQDTYIKTIDYYEVITEAFDTILVSFFPDITTDSQSQRSSEYDKLGNTTALYTAIPIKIGYSFLKNKLMCKMGVIPSFLSYAETYEFANYNQIEKNTSADGFKNLVWNVSLEFEYLVYKNIGIDLNYSRSLNSIYDKDASIGVPKYNIFSVGISYNFFE